MITTDFEPLLISKFKIIKEKWAAPDREKGRTWEFDGVPAYFGHWMTYDHEMREGLNALGCQTFDDLVVDYR